MKDYSEIKDLLMKFSFLGLETSKETGATLIGKAPHIGKCAWLNCIFPTIGEKEILEMEDEIGKKIPASYVDFLTNFSNGLFLLVETLRLNGYRYNYIRSLEYVWQPYSLIDLNTYYVPKKSTKDMFFIGSYVWDGSKLYMTPDEKVHLCQRYDATSLYTWDSLSDMLISEIKRLYKLFDSKGVQIDENQPTIPV